MLIPILQQTQHWLAVNKPAGLNFHSEDGEAGLDEGEALSFLFENWSSVIDHETLTHRLRLFNAELDARKR